MPNALQRCQHPGAVVGLRVQNGGDVAVGSLPPQAAEIHLDSHFIPNALQRTARAAAVNKPTKTNFFFMVTS